ncbi:MAG: hypothetical protein IJG38_01900 [Thermoguttaceae bacterium]|nr:hypothetical protein [Thermoguttaceae bacterium]
MKRLKKLRKQVRNLENAIRHCEKLMAENDRTYWDVADQYYKDEITTEQFDNFANIGIRASMLKQRFKQDIKTICNEIAIRKETARQKKKFDITPYFGNWSDYLPDGIVGQECDSLDEILATIKGDLFMCLYNRGQNLTIAEWLVEDANYKPFIRRYRRWKKKHRHSIGK